MLKDGVIKDLYYGKLFPYEQTTEEKEPTEKYRYESKSMTLSTPKSNEVVRRFKDITG